MGVAGYNLLSIALGLVAIGLAIAGIATHKREGNLFGLLVFASMFFCALSIMFQHHATDSWILAKDFSALMDTVGVSATASKLLLVFTTALNTLGYLLHILRGTKKRG